MAAHEYQIVFTADTSQAIAGMRQVEAAFRQLDGTVNGAGAGLTGIKTKLDAVTDSCHANASAMESATAKGHGFTLAATQIAKAWAITTVLDAATMAMSNMGDMATKARDRIKELAIETMDLRDKMRELANIKGHGGPDNEILAETVQLGINAGMMPDEARKFSEGFQGSIPAGEQKGHIDAKTKEELATEAARFGTRVKLNPHTAGDLAGVIPQYTDLVHTKSGKFTPQRVRKEIAMAQMGHVAYGLNEGRGELEPLVRSLINTAGAVVEDGGPVGNLGEFSAILGVASTHAQPKEAGTRVRQALRGLRDMNGKSGGFLRDAGIEDSDTHVQRLEKIKQTIDAGKANGVDADQLLRNGGFSNEDEMRAIIESAKDIDIIKERVARGKAIDGKSVIKANDEFFRSDKTGVNRKLKANRAGQDVLTGLQNEDYEMAKEAEDQKLRKHKGTWSYWGAKATNDWAGLLPMMGAMPTEERWKMQRADETLMGKARAMGMPEEEIQHTMGIPVHDFHKYAGQVAGAKRTGDYSQYEHDLHQQRRFFPDADRVKQYNALSKKITTGLGNPNPEGPNIMPVLGEIAKEARETNRILREKKTETFVGPPNPRDRPPAPARGAAAPKRP